MKNSALKSLAAYLTVSFLSFAVMAADINNTNNIITIDSQRPDNISDQKWANLKSAVQEEKLVPTPSGIGGRYTKFASSISVDGNRVLIGAPRFDVEADSNPQGAVTVMEYDGSTWNETATLMALDGILGNNFGISVSLSGNRALIGAYRDDDSGFTNSGAVYVFDFDANTNSWSQSQKLTASDLRSNDYFGISVSLSGERALVGSYGDNGGLGSAYIFDLDSNSNNWLESQKLVASDGSDDDYFGYSVSLSGDRALIGSYGDTGRKGSAYIFDLDSNSNDWLEAQKIIASDGASNDYFGYSVSLSGDRVLIGARGDDDLGTDSGSAYVFDLNTNTSIWMETQKLISNAAIPNRQYFGSAVTLSGDRALIGAKKQLHPGNVTFNGEGSAYVFELDINTNIWLKKLELIANDAIASDEFGTSVSLSDDWIMIGAPLKSDTGFYSGSAYVFESINSPFGITWQQTQKLSPTEGASYENFGYSVSLSGDRALIGAYHDGFFLDGTSTFSSAYSGSAYIFDFDNNTNSWTLSQKLTPDDVEAEAEFGKSVSLSGDRALIGAHKEDELGQQAGAAYIFDFDVNNNSWSQTQKLFPDVGDGASFGASVSLSGDRALIGVLFGTGISTRTGSAYIFDINTNTNLWSKSQILFADDGISFTKFGSTVSLLGDRAVIADNAGSAYVFDLDTNNWLQTIKLNTDDGVSFGNSISQSQDWILIGAYWDAVIGTNSGSAYIFKYSPSVPNWVQAQKLTPADGAAYDYFGYSVSLSGNRALIGARATNSTNSTSPGSAYIFDLDTNTDNWSQTQKLTALDGAEHDQFGVSVSLSGDKALIGANFNDGNGIESGAAYVLNLDTYDVSVNVTGLAQGNSLELLNNGGDNLMVNTDSVATFTTSVINGRGYNVTVMLPQPTSPNQNCVVTDPIGTINGAHVELAVTCTTIKYDIGVPVTGLDTSNSIELTSNSQTLNFTGEGMQSFVGIDDETDYAVLLTAQPLSPNQICTITGGNSGDDDGSGTLTGESVNIAVDCITTKYNLDVNVTGLDEDNSIELTSNSQTLDFTGEGMHSFVGIDDGTAYAVLLTAQPLSPNQICTITGGNSGSNNGTGTLTGTDVSITVTCSTNQYIVGGMASGLSNGNSVILSLDTEDLVVDDNDVFLFLNPLADESNYSVSILSQPTVPNQTCELVNPTGTIVGDDIDNIEVNCTTNQYTIGGFVTGLHSGNNLMIQNNGGDDITISSDGDFDFIGTIEDLQGYNVSILNQPTNPIQHCSLSSNTGNVAGSDVTSIAIVCEFGNDLIYSNNFE